MKKNDKKVFSIKNFGVVLICVALVVYFIFTLINANINTSSVIDTEIAKRYTYNENITTPSFIVRNETLLTYNGSKVLYYTVNDGDIVPAGDEVALVFANETDALNFNKLNEVNAQIDILTSLNTSHENVKTDFAAVDKQIELNLRNLILAVNSSNPSLISDSGDSLIYSINQRQIITGVVKNFDEQISSLNEQAQKYINEGCDYSNVITTDVGGYFVAFADGYESAYDYESALDLSVEDFSTDVKSEKVGEDVIGKIVSGLNWYVVCELSSDEAITLSHSNTSTTLTFPSTTCANIPATLVSLNQDSKQSDAVAVFQCNYMNTPISHLRNETVQITVNTFNGLRISKSAIHDEYVEVKDSESGEKKKVQGVYVVHGSELVFKEISIIYAGGDFVIVDENPDVNTLVSGETLKLNDEVVVNGEDLYVGKNV